jgi:Raf kinase inhibitor-like YbhB/YbcL family protein
MSEESFMKLWTDATDSQGQFDARYTCDADNSSPELHWSNAPAKTKSFALVIDDIDAPQGFCHWVVYHIPAHVSHLPAGIAPQDTLPNGIRQGLNSWGRLGYGGPCPPIGHHAHRYLFRLYALSETPKVQGRLNREQLINLIQPITLATAECEGSYMRSTAKKAG